MAVAVPTDCSLRDGAQTALRRLHDAGIRGRIVYRQVLRSQAAFVVVRMPQSATLADMFTASGLAAPSSTESLQRAGDEPLSWVAPVAQWLGIDRTGRCLEPYLNDLRAELAALGPAGRSWRAKTTFAFRAALALAQAAWASWFDEARKMLRAVRHAFRS